MTGSEYKNKPTLQDYFNEAKASKGNFSADNIQQAIQGSAKYQHNFWKSTGIKLGLAITSLGVIVALITWKHTPDKTTPIIRNTLEQKPLVKSEKITVQKANPVTYSSVPQSKARKTKASVSDSVPPSGIWPVQPAVDSLAIDLKKIHPLILNKAVLAKLDISINPSREVCRNAGPVIICYEKHGTVIASSSHINDSIFHLQFTQHDSVRVETMRVKDSYITEVMVTDDLGKAVRAYTSSDDHTPLKNNLNTLIPVLVRSGNEYTAEDEKMHHWRPDVIFWFAPTQRFFDVLPDSIRNTLAAEYKYITATPKQKESLSSGNCEYFEQCKATLNDINSVNVYPNPAERELHVAFTSAKEQSITIEITNLAGQHVALLMPMRSILKGENNLSFNLPPMPAGMYLLVITSADGKIDTERLLRK
jgi:hypothetical protein